MRPSLALVSLPKCSVANTGIRVAEVGVVEEVEELASELDFSLFVNWEFLEQREVHVDAAGAGQHTS